MTHQAPTPAGLPDGRAVATIDLAIGGMTCASCVARVEKKINKLEGATATVNLATETARVELTEDVDTAQLVRAVESAGYTATVVRDSSASLRQPGDHGGADRSPHGADDAHGDPDAGDARSGHSTAGHSTAGHSTAGREDHDADTSSPELARGADLRRRLRLAAVLSVPVTALSMVPPWQFPGWQWVVAVLTLPIVTWSAWPFHRAAGRAARHGSSTMDTLVSLGVIAATGWSLWAILLGGAGEIGMRMQATLLPRAADVHGGMPEPYFEVAAVLTTFLLAGRYAEHRSRRRAGDALRTLLTLGATEATFLTDDGAGGRVETRVPVASLRVGDVFAVRPGEKVATDGEILEGASAVDTSLLTGEPVPVDVGPGSAVTGATVNTSGYLVVRATRVGEDTMLAQIGRLVTQAQTGKAPIQRLADRVSARFVPTVIVLALGTLAVWLTIGASVQAAFTAAVAVLIIACPCALGLATPTALLVGTGRGAQLGILIKGPEILESTRRVDTVVLDKTGTLTEGRMQLVDVLPGVDTTAEEVLRWAGVLESRSEHPIARAIADAAGAGAGLEVTEFANEPGRGVVGVVRPAHQGVELARRVLVGRPTWLRDGDVVTGGLDAAFTGAETDGATAVMVAWDGVARGVLVLRDPLAATSAQAVAELRDLDLDAVLLTGDNAGAARHAAEAAGITEVMSEVLPADKVDAVRALQERGRVVAMVGDGVNDAAALAQADLGLAMGTGTDVAMQAADITLVRGDLRAAAQAIRLSRRTLRVIKQNLFWAFAYNVAAIPLAALGLLNPMIAGAAMVFSSVLVVTNSLRLRRAG